MKRVFITIAIAIMLSVNGLAQNRAVLLHESFVGNAIPAGWSTMGEGGNNWVVSHTNNAGCHEGQSVLDLGQCPKGLYFLKATSEGQQVAAKLTIQ